MFLIFFLTNVRVLCRIVLVLPDHVCRSESIFPLTWKLATLALLLDGK